MLWLSCFDWVGQRNVGPAHEEVTLPTFCLFVRCCCCFCHVNSSPHFVRNVWKVGLSRVALTCVVGVRKGWKRELGRETAREEGGRKQWLACRRSPPLSALTRPNSPFPLPFQRREATAGFPAAPRGTNGVASRKISPVLRLYGLHQFGKNYSITSKQRMVWRGFEPIFSTSWRLLDEV